MTDDVERARQERASAYLATVSPGPVKTALLALDGAMERGHINQSILLDYLGHTQPPPEWAKDDARAYENDDLEIDDAPLGSKSSDFERGVEGCWVSAWVWVEKPEGAGKGFAP